MPKTRVLSPKTGPTGRVSGKKLPVGREREKDGEGEKEEGGRKRKEGEREKQKERQSFENRIFCTDCLTDSAEILSEFVYLESYTKTT